MAIPKKQAKIVKEIQKSYGNSIDLERSPGVLIEILRNYGHVFAGLDDPNGGTGTGGTGTGGTGTGGTGTGGTGTGGTGTGTSSIAGSGPPSEGVENAVLLRAILNMQRDVKVLGKQMNKLGAKKLR